MGDQQVGVEFLDDRVFAFGGKVADRCQAGRILFQDGPALVVDEIEIGRIFVQPGQIFLQRLVEEPVVERGVGDLELEELGLAEFHPRVPVELQHLVIKAPALEKGGQQPVAVFLIILLLEVALAQFPGLIRLALQHQELDLLLGRLGWRKHAPVLVEGAFRLVQLGGLVIDVEELQHAAGVVRKLFQDL